MLDLHTPERVTTHDDAPALPRARGPVSGAVLEVLGGQRAVGDLPRPSGLDPYGEDLQLALYVCYELHYRSFPGVDPELEWDPDLLALRRALERTFLAALQAEVAGGDDVDGAIDALLVEPVEGTGPSWHHRRRAASCGSCASTSRTARSTTSRRPTPRRG